MTYEESVNYLYGLRLFGAKLGLENTQALAEMAGNPHHRLHFVHVAGTNGKGSVCAMLESIYRRAGYRVGLYTSPHLISFCERIQVDREWITAEDVTRHVRQLREWIAAMEPRHPTFFEAITVMAMIYFVERQCDIVIWETGLGGRLDATNVVTPKIAVITNIQLDHEKWLGTSISAIAHEKAGIIKPGVPVATACRNPEAIDTLIERTREVGAEWIHVPPEALDHPPLLHLRLSLPGEHQRTNAALAFHTVRRLQKEFPVSDQDVLDGLATVDWPGRLQTMRWGAHQTLILDGAHNPDSIEALRHHLDREYPSTRWTFLVGVLQGKHWEAMFATLAPVMCELFLCPVSCERGIPPQELADRCGSQTSGILTRVCGSLNEAVEHSQMAEFRIITGSLHFIGEAMEILHLIPKPARDEKPLNDWRITP